MNLDQTRLGAAYMARRDALTRFLVARTGSREEADDLMQELFLKVSRAAPQVEIGDPVSYLFRAALNLARDRRRDRARAHVREATWSDARHVMSGSQAISDAPAADAALAAKQRIAAVHRALDELSPQCRRVFVLHKFDGLSHQQVAERVGIARTTVEKHMHTALKHLIERLGRD